MNIAPVPEFYRGQRIGDSQFRESLESMRQVCNSLRSISGAGIVQVEHTDGGLLITATEAEPDGFWAVIGSSSSGDAYSFTPRDIGLYGGTAENEGPAYEINGRVGVPEGTNVFLRRGRLGGYPRFYFDITQGHKGGDPKTILPRSDDRSTLPGTGTSSFFDLSNQNNYRGAIFDLASRFVEGTASEDALPKLFWRDLSCDANGNIGTVGKESARDWGSWARYIGKMELIGADTLRATFYKTAMPSTVADGTQDFTFTGSGVAVDEKVAVVNGQTPGYLNEVLLVTAPLTKSVSGSTLTLAINFNDGTSFPPGWNLDEKVKTSGNDTTAGYLWGTSTGDGTEGELQADETWIKREVLNGGANEQLRLFHGTATGITGTAYTVTIGTATITFDSCGHYNGTNQTIDVAQSLGTVAAVTAWRYDATTHKFQIKTRAVLQAATVDTDWTDVADGSQPATSEFVEDTDFTSPNFKERKRAGVYVLEMGATSSSTVFTTGTC